MWMFGGTAKASPLIMKQPSSVDGRVLDFRLSNFMEWYESERSLAIKAVNERFAWRIGSMVDDHGAPAVDSALKDYRITVGLPKTLHDVFGPTIMPYLWTCEE
jgi:hypothetical protein